MDAQPDPCIEKERCGGDAEQAWKLPAGILNILWADIYPRLVAQRWMTGMGVWPGMTKSDLIAQIGNLVSNPLTGPEFHKRKCLVRDYLDLPYSVPVSVPAEGAYDFVLHGNGVGADRGGLELFIPQRPKLPEDIIRFYSFRETGRPALGLPFYLATPYSAVAVDAPRGPGMVWVPETWVRGLLDRFGRCPDLECVSCALKQLLEHAQERDVYAERKKYLRWDRDRLNEEGKMKWVPLENLGAYTCLMKKTRCWQIEGTVYRALMTETPRIVATIWLEYYIKAAVQDYAARWGGQGNGLRSIFEERLELTLPDADHMVFEPNNSTAGNLFQWNSGSTVMGPPLTNEFVTQTGAGQPYDLNKDVIITNQGFYFPETTLTPGWITDDFLKEVAEGRAGNPVFSSTERSEMS